MAIKTQPSKDETIKQVVSELDGPALIEDVIDEVLRRWPSQAKNARGGIRSHMRSNISAENLLILDDALVAPTGLVMRGVRFRIPITAQEAEKGAINLFPAFRFFWKQQLADQQIEFQDVQGEPIRGALQMESERKTRPFGDYTQNTLTFRMAEWFKKEGIRANDSLIVTVEDWDAGHFRLEREAAEISQRRQAEREAADRRLMDWLYDRLDNSGRDSIFAEPAILAAHVQNCVYPAYPGNHWQDAMQRDRRMECWDGHTIRYADPSSPLDLFSDERDELDPPEMQPLAPEVAEKVFTFYAYLKNRKNLWRRIEIQGEHDLQDFDDILRSAFGHDWDHLSGFWQRIRRGKTKRYREVELATTSSYSEYRENAEQQVGNLDIKVGDQLKYVYDFGDWIEHTLELEAIGAAEAGAEYPRISERNAPQYRNCIECKIEGRTTRAIWHCYTCSDEDAVLLCDECAEDHEDHHLEDILY